VIGPDTQIDALAAGEIDAMEIGPDVNKYNRATGMSHVEIRRAGGPNLRHITFNGESELLRDVRVRRAIAMGIDRSSIARALLGPLGEQPVSLDNHIFISNQTGYNDNSGNIGRFSPDTASRLLDSLGWKLDGAVRTMNGRPLEISLVIPSDFAPARQESELIQHSLSQIGVRVKIDVVPRNAFFADYVTPGAFDITVFSWMGTPYPVSSKQAIYSRPTRGADEQLNVQQNYGRIGTEEIDRLFALASDELDRTKVAELANRADSLIWQVVHSLTMYQRPELIATNRKLANFGAFGFQAPWAYADIGWIKE
jgi:peptide/nickel transport system substrate-binding protein